MSIEGNPSGVLRGDLAVLRRTIRDLNRAGLSAEDVRREVFAELDATYGGMWSIVHRAGPPRADGQFCVRCWCQLAEPGETAWPHDAEVWEVRRWGEATNPRAMGVREPGPLHDEDEQMCAPS